VREQVARVGDRAAREGSIRRAISGAEGNREGQRRRWTGESVGCGALDAVAKGEPSTVLQERISLVESDRVGAQVERARTAVVHIEGRSRSERQRIFQVVEEDVMAVK
jgi:hypothetical protein